MNRGESHHPFGMKVTEAVLDALRAHAAAGTSASSTPEPPPTSESPGAGRILVGRAEDAPAPTIVIDGLGLRGRPGRAEVAEFMAPRRRHAMTLAPNLGAKTMVLLKDPAEQELEVHFFQGMADGSYEMSATTCLNSAAVAAAAATSWGAGESRLDIRMAGGLYRFVEVPR